MTLSKIWGTRYPLIQSPMAGVQGSQLALAVSAAGALGSLPAAMLDADGLRRELLVLQGSGLPYNVNFFCHQTPGAKPEVDTAWRSALQPYYDELKVDPASISASGGRRPFDGAMAEVLEEFRPTVVSFHFGLPDQALLARVKARGAFVISSATTLPEAQWLEQHGADAVIAQGLEAGGHRGHFLSRDVARQANTMDLLKRVVGHVSVPVMAAGGIANAEGVQAAMAAGAAGVQVGTAFLLCHESNTGTLHRQRLSDQAAPTALTNIFSGGLARGLVNRAMRELGPISNVAPPFPLASNALAPLRAQAESLGRDDFTPLWSGTNRSGCREAPAAEVVNALARGFTLPPYS